jgi:YidC/Oxa1 family membrane protein insertase
MMIFMGAMFYKVPSGLGLYFITSSLWAICERLLLPKVTHAQPLADGGASESGKSGDNASGTGGILGWFNGNGGGGDNGGLDGNGAKIKAPGRVSQFFGRVLDEARKDPTYRKMVDERDAKRDEKDRDRDRDRPRPKPRRR